MVMHFVSFTLRLSLVLFIALGSFAGCGSNSVSAPKQPTPRQVDPHDVPLTSDEIKAIEDGVADYDDALSQIRSLRDQIRDAIADGNPSKAHRPLDELDVVIGRLPEAAIEGKIPKSNWLTIQDGMHELRSIFKDLHSHIDSGLRADYASESDDIDKIISTLADANVEALDGDPEPSDSESGGDTPPSESSDSETGDSEPTDSDDVDEVNSSAQDET